MHRVDKKWPNLINFHGTKIWKTEFAVIKGFEAVSTLCLSGLAKVLEEGTYFIRILKIVHQSGLSKFPRSEREGH